jgi:hypothetical protein
MPEKYELFLDKNKKVKLAANDQGEFFAEANGNRIKLGEQGLQTINKTTGAPESVGGAPDPNLDVTSLAGVAINGLGEDSGRNTFTHSDLPGETLVGWYVKENAGQAPKLFLTINPAYLSGGGTILSDPNGNQIYKAFATPEEELITIRINGTTYTGKKMELKNHSWYNASQINFSGSTTEGIVLAPANSINGYGDILEMENDILAVALSTELVPGLNFSNGFSLRNGGIYGIPLSADITIPVINDIDVTTPIKFSGGAKFSEPVNGLVTDNDITDLLGTDNALFSNKTPYSSSTSDLRFTYTQGALHSSHSVTTPKLIEGNTYRLSCANGGIVGNQLINFDFTDNEEFFGIELDIHRPVVNNTTDKIKGKSYIDILVGFEGNLSLEAGGHKHIIFYFSESSGGNGAQYSQPGQYFIYTIDNPTSGREIKNSFTSGDRGMPRVNNAVSQTHVQIGDANPAGFWSAGQTNKIRIYLNDFKRVSGEFVGNGIYGKYTSAQSHGFQSQPNSIIPLDLTYLASIGYTGVSHNNNPYSHSDYTSSDHLTISMAPNSTVWITDSAGPDGTSLSSSNTVGIILDLSYLRNGDTFAFAYDAISSSINGSNYNPTYYVAIILKFGSRGYKFNVGSSPNYGGFYKYQIIGSTTTGELQFFQPSGSVYSTQDQSYQNVLI